MKIWIFQQRHASIGVVFRQIISTCANGEPIKCNIFVAQTVLIVKRIRFPRHRRKKWHSQPEHKLGGFTFNTNFVLITINHLCAKFCRLCKLFKIHNVIFHHFCNGRLQLWIGKTFDLINVIFCGQFTRSCLRKIANRIDTGKLRIIYRVINVMILCIFCKSRMRLKFNMLFNVDNIVSKRNLVFVSYLH